MKTPEDEAFDDLAKKQGAWGGGFKAKQAMAANKLQEPRTMDDRQRLEAIVSVINKYLPPFGMHIMDAMSAIISLVDPLPPPPAQEPVAWEQFYPDIGKPQIALNAEEVGYVAPQRTWVGLTDEEVNDCIKSPNRNLFARDGTTSQRIARATEAKLKEKNT